MVGATVHVRNIAIDALVDLIGQIEKAKTAGATDAQLQRAREFQRKAQFLVDFIEAENSMGFHAPQEAARILVKSVDYSRRGQVALAAPPAAGSEAASTRRTE